LWLIYSQPVITITVLESLLEEQLHQHISMSAGRIVDEFKRLGLVQIEKSDGETVVRRIKPAISFMHHSLGKRILLSETESTLSKYSKPANPELSNSVMLYSLMFVSPEDRQTILRRIQEFVAQIYSAAQDTFKDKLESESVFFSVQLSPRPEYYPASLSEPEEPEKK